jgi:alkylation response protein AidB-like acyl-CoA dehydrogenase
VRTDPNARKRQEGISFLLVDMKTPGITVRPIISIDNSHHLNEVFFDDVKVPVAMRIHAENKGWDVAKFLLGNERTGIARLGKSRERVSAAVSMAKEVNFGGAPLIEDQIFRQRVAQLQVDMKALEITQYRVVSAYDRAKGAGKPDPLSSVLKVKGTELLQATSELAVDVAGPLATPMWAQELEALNEPDELMEAGSAGTGGYLMLRAASIYGGTNEIQKNILTKAVLGL